MGEKAILQLLDLPLAPRDLFRPRDERGVETSAAFHHNASHIQIAFCRTHKKTSEEPRASIFMKADFII